jgi:phosphatidate cytidylyltransferase
MKTRLIIGPLLIALVAGLFWMDATLLSRPSGFIILAGAAGLLCVHEAAALLTLAGLAVDRMALFTGSIVLLGGASGAPGHASWAVVLADAAFLTAATTCFVLLLVCSRNIWHPDVKRFPQVLAGTMTAFIYAGVPPALLIAVRRLETPGDPHLGMWLILTLIVCVRLGADTCAYFAGKAFGRRKLIPHVSPGKTVEGLLGGFIGAVGLGWACFAVMPGLSREFALWEMLVFAGAVGLVAPVGDLAESALKRAAGVKDSGKLLPEFGGVLDVIDGLLLTGPLLYLVLLWRLG